MRSKILSKLIIFASCVWYSDSAYYWVCVLIKDTCIGRRFPLELHRSLCQGQQGDLNQPVRGNYKTCFWGGQNCVYIQGCTLKFCRVCRYRVRVWGLYRTSRSFGYGYGSVTELSEVPGIVAQAYRTHGSSGRVQNMLYPYPGYCGTGLTELTEVPGTCMKVLQNFQKFRVLCRGRTELPEVPGRYKHTYPYPGSLWHRRTELPEVPGTGISVLQKLRKIFVG